MIFDRIAILDWSAAKGPRLGKDSIWLAVAEAGGEACTALNLPTRLQAEAALIELCRQTRAKGQRLLLGADFAFGAPQGFIPALTGQANALSWWGWLADRITETPKNESNYRQIAALMNSRFGGDGPFWGNGEKQPTPGLPRLMPPLPAGLRPHRQTDQVARGPGSAPKPIWQLAGAGAVGAQVLTGLPVLHRVRQHFAGHVAVWPFEPATRPIVLVEVYPSLLAEAVRAHVARTGSVVDEAQVRLLACALARLGPGQMQALFTAPDTAEEGWILGAGQEALLRRALG